MITLRKDDTVVNLVTKLDEINFDKLECNYEVNNPDTNVLVTIINRLSMDDIFKLAKNPAHKCDSAGSILFGKSDFTNKELVLPIWAVEQDLVRLPNKGVLSINSIISEISSITNLDTSVMASLQLAKYIESTEDTSPLMVSNTKILFAEFGIISRNSIKGYSKEANGTK